MSSGGPVRTTPVFDSSDPAHPDELRYAFHDLINCISGTALIAEFLAQAPADQVERFCHSIAQNCGKAVQIVERMRALSAARNKPQPTEERRSA